MRAEALADVVDALGGRRARAIRDGISPRRVFFVELRQRSRRTLAGDRLTMLYVYLIPVRGVDNLADCDAERLDAVHQAVAPIAWADVTSTTSSVTVNNDTWPCYRVDVPGRSSPP